MSAAERERWNARYRAGAYANRQHPSQVLKDWLPEHASGRALDVACGAGHNAIYLAEHGFETDAIDISTVALERAASLAQKKRVTVNWIAADLDLGAAVLPDNAYDLIVLIRYVELELYPLLIDRLAPGGILISEQHLQTDLDVIGPANPRFRVPSGALRAAATSLELIHYHEGLVADAEGRRAALAQIIARC